MKEKFIKEYLNNQQLENIVLKDLNKNNYLNQIYQDLINITEQFLIDKNKKNEYYIKGISTKINLNNVDINIIGGINNESESITQDTKFDIASVTKLFTLLLFFQLEKLKIIDLNKNISYYTKYYTDLHSFTINDILLMTGNFKTTTRIDEEKTKSQALKTLKNILVIDKDKTKIKYTDIGLCILADILENIFNESYDQILNQYLLEPLNLNDTTYYPSDNIAGNGNKNKQPHDPKAKILIPTASAGLFTTNNDLLKLTIFMNNFKEKLLYKINKDYKIGYVGLCHSHKDINIVPKIFSNQTITSQGYTGCYVTKDLKNNIHNSILTNTIENNKKPDNYLERLINYKLLIALKTIELDIISKYENIEIKKTLKI